MNELEFSDHSQFCYLEFNFLVIFFKNLFTVVVDFVFSI